MLCRFPVSDFPGPAKKATESRPLNPGYWIDAAECSIVHRARSIEKTSVPKEFGHGSPPGRAALNPGRAMTNMALPLRRHRSGEGLCNCSATGPTAVAAATPSAKPERPKASSATSSSACGTGSTPKYYLHDSFPPTKRNPTVNANGMIYDRPKRAPDLVPVLDPVKISRRR